jgi:acyl carrier protein
MTSVNNFLKEIILELKDIDEDRLTEDLSIQELALESLDYVELQVLVKKRYGVEVNPDLFMNDKLKPIGPPPHK